MSESMGGNQGPPEDAITVGPYQAWMLDQVIEMFVSEYGREADDERKAFLEFYEHPYQRQHGIRLAAWDGETVCGFQSFFSWPYRFEGRQLRVFQSGRSLVSPDYRGRRIFARLLNHIWESGVPQEIDFLMGFAVEMSYGSFLRNGWSAPLDLAWDVRVLRPMSAVRARMPSDEDFRLERVPSDVVPYLDPGSFALSRSPDFMDWRTRIRSGDSYYYFTHEHGGSKVRFELKPNRRGRINEMILGDVVRDSGDPALLEAGVKELVRVLKGHRFLTMLSIASNPGSRDPSLAQALAASGFRRVKPRVHFIVKPVREVPGCEDPSRWWLLRSDIDTW